MVLGCFCSPNENSIEMARAGAVSFFFVFFLGAVFLGFVLGVFFFFFPNTKKQSLLGTLALFSASNAKWEIIGLTSSWDISGASGRKAGIGK